jgi:hypothetical protein
MHNLSMIYKGKGQTYVCPFFYCLPAGPSFVWQQKKQKCPAPGRSATCQHSMPKLQKLACGSDTLQFNAIFARQVPACATKRRD